MKLNLSEARDQTNLLQLQQSDDFKGQAFHFNNFTPLH